MIGENWLRMTPTERLYFVEGYRKGSAAGHLDACELLSGTVRDRLPPASTPGGITLDPCQARARSWSVGTEAVVKQVDEFYSRFPDTREVQVTNLIQNLSDQAALTIEQIHEMASEQRPRSKL